MRVSLGEVAKAPTASGWAGLGTHMSDPKGCLFTPALSCLGRNQDRHYYYFTDKKVQGAEKTCPGPLS